MNFEIKHIDQTRRQMIAQVDKETYEKDYQKTFKSFSQEVQINGFRKGKAPATTIKRFYEQQILSAYHDDYMEVYYKRGLAETNVTPVTGGSFVDAKFEENGVLTFVFEFETLPEGFEYEYKGLKVQYKAEEYDEQMLTDTINNLLRENTEEIPFDENQTLEIGDKVKLSEIGSGVEIPFFVLEQEDMDDDPDLSAKQIVADKIKGLKINDRFQVENGVEYQVTDAFKMIVPQLNDETAKILGHENVDALKNSLKEDILKRLEDNNHSVLYSSIIFAFGVHNKENLKIPNEYMNSVGKRIILRELGGNINPDMLDSIENDLFFEIAERHLPSIVWDLSYEQVAKDHNITVSEEEVDHKIIEIANHYNISADDFKDKFTHNIDSIKDEILGKKVLDFIKPFCEIVEQMETESIDDITENTSGSHDENQFESAEYEIVDPPPPSKPKRGRPKKQQ